MATIAALGRAEPWLTSRRKNAGLFFAGVAGLTLWTAGFIDLLTPFVKPLFNTTTMIGTTAFTVAYLLGYVVWLSIVLPISGPARAGRTIAYIQSRPMLGIAAVATCAAVLFSMLFIRRWAQLPLFELSMFLTALLVAGVIVLARPAPGVRMQFWRKGALVLAGAVLALELALQAAAATGVLPFENLSGLFTAYGRVYQNREGFVNSATNRFGWYSPDHPIDRPPPTLILTGGDFIQGLQVSQQAHLSQALQRLLPANGPKVISLGYPGYGATLYANPNLAPYTMLRYNPREVIVFFHLANDVQASPEASSQPPRYALDAEGAAVVLKQDQHRLHMLQHLAIRAYDPVNLVQTLHSHSFLAQLIKRAIGQDAVYQEMGDTGVAPDYPGNIDNATEAAPFGAATFAFETGANPRADEAMAIATAQLAALKQQLDQLGIKMRLVSIPYFPAQFYAETSGPAFSPTWGRYDLLKPERSLAEFARQHEIPFLPIGEHLMRAGAAPADIRGLFLSDGVGRFSAAGHSYVAQAIAACFFDQGGPCPIAAP